MKAEVRFYLTNDTFIATVLEFESEKQLSDFYDNHFEKFEKVTQNKIAKEVFNFPRSFAYSKCEVLSRLD